jgi:hypothetical protein
MVRERPSEDRRDRVVTADHQRHDGLADDLPECLVRAARVLVARAELERHVSDVDQAWRALAKERAPQVEVVMG